MCADALLRTHPLLLLAELYRSRTIHTWNTHQLQVERDTADSMKLLMQLDEVKTRMEATSEALQEADNWETLSAEVEDAFASNDLPRISSTLLGMKRSLMVRGGCRACRADIHTALTSAQPSW